ncbi:hypothetical protein KA977_06845 [Candidatus Dependentiae bacterium]|nr:hypothetical protein [Candidatus Dependentiae bacterium]
MNVLLIQPAIEDFYITKQRTFPTGLIYIANYLQKFKINVKILDCVTGIKPLKIKTDDDFEYLNKYYVKDFSPAKLFHDFFRFGYSNEKFESILKTKYYDTDYFCISSNFTPYYKTVIEYCGIIKKNFSGKPVIAGGNNIPVMFELLLKSGVIDFTVFREGEETLKNLLLSISSPENVPNIAFIRNNQLIITHKSDNFNINDNFYKLDFIDTEKYKIGKQKCLSLVTSRGCGYSCTFCSSNKNTTGYSKKNIEIVKNEISYNIKRYGLTALNIEDENFTSDKFYTFEFCEFIIKNFSDLKLYFMNGLHYINLDSNLIKCLNKSGMQTLNISLVDCGAQNFSRKTDLKLLSEIIQAAYNLNMLVTVYLIIGLPGQSYDDLIKALEFLTEQKNVVIGPSIFYPLPNLDIFKYHKSKIDKIPYSAMRMTAACYETDFFSKTDLITFFRLIRTLNLIKIFNSENNIELPELGNNNIVSNVKLNQSLLFKILYNKIKTEKKLFGINDITKKSEKFYYKLFSYEQNFDLSKNFIEKFYY